MQIRKVFLLMRSIFRFEKNKGGVYTNTFADISKKDTFLVKRILTNEELIKLNEMNITKNNSLNSQQE